MDENGIHKILQDLYCSIEEYFEEFTDQIIKQAEMSFLGMGMGYIKF